MGKLIENGAVEAIKLGAYDFLEKPFKSDRLLLVVERAIEAAQLRRENEELRLRAGGDLDLVGISPAASQLRQQIERVAPTGSRVLITGPPGSGKEVVGRLLHARSRRSKGPFVPVNCATMRPERLEIELFGTETRIDGAPRKLGTFERAHGGTLFLDEVADMPLETQGKIVRALQEQTFERVGGLEPRRGRCPGGRLVIGNSAARSAPGRFREDLFYRLSVVPIAGPRFVIRARTSHNRWRVTSWHGRPKRRGSPLATHDGRRRGELKRDGEARSSAAHHARHLPLGVARPLGVALVVQLLSLAERQRHLRHSVLEVELEGNQGQSLALDGPYQTTDFLAVEQQLAGPRGLVIRVTPAFVRRDVQVEQKGLAVLHDSVRVADVRLPVAERLDFGAREHEPRLAGLEDVVVVTRPLVPRDRLDLVCLVDCACLAIGTTWRVGLAYDAGARRVGASRNVAT